MELWEEIEPREVGAKSYRSRHLVKVGRSFWENGIQISILDFEGGRTMKLSTRNQIKGKVTQVVKGTIAAKVKIDIGGGNVITSMITVDAVNDLKLKKGDQVIALIKASSVMIGK